MTDSINFKSGYSEVNDLNMYYEIHGQGKPLVLIHGGGSTIRTTFGKILPLLAKNRQIIAVELQAHGHTGDRNKPLSFAQDADDVAKLLENLHINKADILGFSNGGQTTMEIAMKYPSLVGKIVICSVFYKRSAVFPQFWEGMKHAKLSDMPKVYQDEYLKIKNDSTALLNMFNRDVERMVTFKDWSDEQIKSIQAPTLLISGTHDVGSPEHAVEMYRLIPKCQLAILPGTHGTYLGEIATLNNGKWTQEYATDLIEQFLEGIE